MIERRTERALDSVAALRRWRDALVAAQRADAPPLAGDLESRLVAGLVAMRERGELVGHADPAALATAVVAAVHGGVLLARATGTTRPLELAMDMAIDHVQAHVW